MVNTCINCGAKIYGHQSKRYCGKCRPLFVKSEAITISFTPQEKDKIVEYADMNNMSNTEVIRFFLREDGLI